jgi:hypothetical protein
MTHQSTSACPEERPLRIHPPEGGASFFDHQPELYAAFNSLYSSLWSEGCVDQPTKEVARLRNARLVDCGL